MTDNQKNIDQKEEIDLLKLFTSLWDKRMFLLKAVGVGFVLGLIIAISIPNQYDTTVVLAPEASSGSGSSGMGALAAMAGVNVPSAKNDIWSSPSFYPSILSSTPFLSNIANIELTDPETHEVVSLYNYMKDEQKHPWWNSLMGLPGRAMSLFSSSKNDQQVQKDSTEINRFVLTGEELGVYSKISSSLRIDVDPKNSLMYVTVSLQDPNFSAFLADTVVTYLQKYIINYRTQKAREDLMFSEKLFKEARHSYYEKQERYATYTDENRNVTSARYNTTQQKLQNELSLAYNTYTQVSQQLQLAKIKVQDTTPVYSVIQPAIISNNKSAPKTKLIIIAFVFVAFFGASIKVFIQDVLIKK